MEKRMLDQFKVRTQLGEKKDAPRIYSLKKLAETVGFRLEDMPYSVRVLLESLVRNCDGKIIREDDVLAAARWRAESGEPLEVQFMPARVLLQDFTGVPAVVDLAAMRDALAELGGDPAKITPLIPVDLVIDHSVQVDHSGSDDALEKNVTIEYGRNEERYRFLRWGQQAFRNFRVVPPSSGIIHQVNLEHLATVVFEGEDGAGGRVLYPDSVVGTDSHTTMINGLGVVGWGVGGIEAEAVMLGQPVSIVVGGVVGVRVSGKPKPGVTATDIVLTVTDMLRKHKVVGKFVEFFGPGVPTLSLADRATLANMAPEYGATTGFFPVDAETLRYLELTGRDAALTGQYYREAGLFCDENAPAPVFSSVVELDLSAIVPCVAGPKRPQDRVPLDEVADGFRKSLMAPVAERGFGVDKDKIGTRVALADGSGALGHGSVIIASITSCTNTSNPAVMLAAGLVAKKAVDRGLRVPGYVKTSLAPGSRVVESYLARADLLQPLEKLGFHIVGYGCATCIGNSGPVSGAVADAVKSGDLVAAAVLSGNRNFEGRISPQARANYLASPPLVVAYALAGRVDIDFDTESLGSDHQGNRVWLRDIWPTDKELADAQAGSIDRGIFEQCYADVFYGDSRWADISAGKGLRFDWDPASTYVRLPPYFEGLKKEAQAIQDITDARVLAVLGDSVTTDHISPAGSIAKDGPAAKYLESQGVTRENFNSFGSRRGNHEVMMRGTLANIRLKNLMLPGTEGGITKYVPSGETLSIYDAAMRYQKDGVPMVILAGRDYGMGSSRDWAAKGVQLLGVRAVIAVSYERIHRSNLVGMGVLPLEFVDGQDAGSLGFDRSEVFSIPGLDRVTPGCRIEVTAKKPDGRLVCFSTVVRVDAAIEVEYLKHGGILPMMVRHLRG
ncbi:MAG TPA: aconitate hydratase AcnA [Spirochaetota bacterium]|nr:aconitate hydratase AcnA [Spirochaetota bacterium]